MPARLCFLFLLLAGCASSESLTDKTIAEQQVMQTERAFAQTMAMRDHAAFTSFLSEEAIFFAGETPLHGKAQVAAGWKKYFDGPDAPFSWDPRQVEVLDSGTLALSSGPVFDPDGQCVGTFTSIWRQERPGTWRVVFDKGSSSCEYP